MKIVGIPFYKIMLSTLNFEDNDNYDVIKKDFEVVNYDYTQAKKDLREGTSAVLNTFLELEFTSNVNEWDRYNVIIYTVFE